MGDQGRSVLENKSVGFLTEESRDGEREGGLGTITHFES